MGIILGPSVTGWIHPNETVKILGEIGVYILLFMAGLETDIHKMKREGRTTLLTASLGVTLPFFAGLLLCHLWGFSLIKGLLVGTILTATSVSVTVMTLWDMKRLDGTEGRIILGSAIIDDVFGVLILTLILALFGKGGPSLWVSLSKLVLFFVASFALGLFIGPIMHYSERLRADKSLTAISFGIMLLFAWLARVCQLATITGTYMAGLMIGLTTLKQKVLSEINTIGQSIFIPLFFITIGLEAQLSSVAGYLLFGVLFIALAILTKIIGCGTGAWLGGRHSLKECTRIGIGMIPRAEVALAIASVGLAHSIITKTDFSLTILLCLTTALITPVLLRISFAGEAREA